jgi:outer membrane translocation and assembly module TamA
MPGSRAFGIAGLSARAEFDSSDSALNPRSGARFSVNASTFPAVWGDAPRAFTRGDLLASVYLPLSAALDPVVALRAGGERVWGDAPFQYAAFLGGSNLRGHSTHRFAGDAALYGNAELRTRVGRANLLLVTGEIGTIARGDIGRVFLDGEKSDRWHSAVGGGLWFATLEGSLAVHLLYAYGERSTLNVGLGLPF